MIDDEGFRFPLNGGAKDETGETCEFVAIFFFHRRQSSAGQSIESNQDAGRINNGTFSNLNKTMVSLSIYRECVPAPKDQTGAFLYSMADATQ